MKAHLTRRYVFSASHRLHSDALGAAENQAIYGKCNNSHGHGHNYFLEVTVSGQVNGQTGMVYDLGKLDGTVKREVLDRFDHENLNLKQEFSSKVPTTENLGELVFEILKQSLNGVHLEKVRIEETMMNSFEYAGGAELRR